GRNVADIDADTEITLVDEKVEDQGRTEETVSTTALITTADVTPDELTMAQALVEIKKSKPKGDKFVIEQEPEQGVTTTTTITIPTPDSIRPKPRGAVMKEPSETPTTTTIPKSSKVQDKGKDRLAEEKSQQVEDENLAWDNVQAMMDADYELAARAEEQRRKPPNKAQKRNQMCVYWKNMVGFTHNQLKNKSFDEVHKAFDKTMSLINSFVPMDSKVVKDKTVLTQESSSKRAVDELDQGRSKKQKVKDNKEQEELKRCLEIIPDDRDDVTINTTPLSIKNQIINYKIYKEGKKIDELDQGRSKKQKVKDNKEQEELKRCLEIIPDDRDDVTINTTPLSIKNQIINYKIYKEGKKSYFQVFRADGNSHMYYTFSKMLKNFNREDLEVL
nr:hypothetical protein [Tanacetum cinerariifolium]GEZ54958.1 hypothetical protein [Tanacetum cinerariifolium]